METHKAFIPVVEKVVDFSSKSAFQHEVTYVDGLSLKHAMGMTPVVQYRCKLEKGMKEIPSLNAFIKSITVAKATTVLEFQYEDTKGVFTGKNEESRIVYCETKNNLFFAISQLNVIQIVNEIPNLVVSSEGVLLFYTENEILATSDCNQYVIITNGIIDLKGRKVKNITLGVKGCAVHFIDQENKVYAYSLTFSFDMALNNVIVPRASFIGKVGN